MMVAVAANPVGAATPQTWTGWTLNSASGCSTRAEVPYINVNGQIVGYTQVYCSRTTSLTVRGRIRSDRTLSDVTVAHNGCSSSDGTCAISVGAGYTNFFMACPKTSTRVTHGYHTDIIIYPGANVYAATGSTSGSTTQSPYCAN
ncbi:MAG: hypothetical protein QOG50_1730 [Actinomycetota bacterium]|nr:hypothetical protein [Actinomycetota bacterium]